MSTTAEVASGVSGKDVWSSRRDLSRKSSCESSTKSEMSTDDWPLLSEVIDKVTKLTVDVKTPPVSMVTTNGHHSSVTTNGHQAGVANERTGRKGSSSPNGTDSCSSIGEEPECWGDCVPETAEETNGEAEGDGTMSRSTAAAVDVDAPLATVDEPEQANGVAEPGSRRKSSKASKLKWIPLPLPDLPPLKQRTGRRPPTKRSDKPKNKPDGTTSNGTNGVCAQSASDTRNKLSPKAGAKSSGGKHFNVAGKSRRVASLSPSSPVSGEFPDFGLVGSPVPGHSGSEFLMPYTWHAPDYCPLPPQMDDILLITLLRHQIEYYFGVENLSRDFFLRRKMDSEGYLPIHLIASFQRVQKLTSDIDKVSAAIQSSSMLELKDCCVRTLFNPLRWPIMDNVPMSPVSLVSRTFTLPMPCPVGNGIAI